MSEIGKISEILRMVAIIVFLVYLTNILAFYVSVKWLQPKSLAASLNIDRLSRMEIYAPNTYESGHLFLHMN
jgi:hypothetical protein